MGRDFRLFNNLLAPSVFSRFRTFARFLEFNLFYLFFKLFRQSTAAAIRFSMKNGKISKMTFLRHSCMANNLQVSQKKSACSQSLSMTARTICSFWHTVAEWGTGSFSTCTPKYSPFQWRGTWPSACVMVKFLFINNNNNSFQKLFYWNRPSILQVNHSHRGSLWTGFWES